jgi:hypothetical protein
MLRNEYIQDTGEASASAYDLALTNGFVGTEAQWLTSLQGVDGADGADAPLYAPIVTVTGNYTVVAGDLGKLIRVDSEGAVVLTFPDGLLAGFWISVQLVGNGTIEIAATATESVDDLVFLKTKYAGCSVVQINGTGTYSIIGQLEG